LIVSYTLSPDRLAERDQEDAPALLAHLLVDLLEVTLSFSPETSKATGRFLPLPDVEKCRPRPWTVARPLTWLRTVSLSNREARGLAGLSRLFG